MRSPLTDIVVTPMWRGLGNPRCLAARLPYRAERISFDWPAAPLMQDRLAYGVLRTRTILHTNINKNPTNPQSKRLIRLPHPVYRRANQNATSEHLSPRDRHIRLQSAALGATPSAAPDRRARNREEQCVGAHSSGVEQGKTVEGDRPFRVSA